MRTARNTRVSLDSADTVTRQCFPEWAGIVHEFTALAECAAKSLVGTLLNRSYM